MYILYRKLNDFENVNQKSFNLTFKYQITFHSTLFNFCKYFK